MIRPLHLLVFAGFFHLNATAQSLDSSAEKLDEQERKKIYDRFIGEDFSKVASELARGAPGERYCPAGYVSHELLQSPWKGSLGFVYGRAWAHHANFDYQAGTEGLGEHMETLLTVLEDRGVGSGRGAGVSEIARYLRWNRSQTTDESLPENEAILRRVRAIAVDDREPDGLRRFLLPTLFEYDDPNPYLDLAMELASREGTPLAKAEAFRFAVPVRDASSFNPSNRAKFVRHAFSLLEEIDDKHSGKGYFLAMAIGSFLGVQPVASGQGAFAPDQRLEKYQGEHGLTDAFFQKTVENAMDWWEANKADYENSPDEAGQPAAAPDSKSEGNEKSEQEADPQSK